MPTDSDTGALTSVRKNDAFQIVKAIDKSSPLLSKAVSNGESFPSLKLDRYRIDEKGDEVLYAG
jgi:type VI secretion system secreted protein Hcp